MYVLLSVFVHIFRELIGNCVREKPAQIHMAAAAAAVVASHKRRIPSTKETVLKRMELETNIDQASLDIHTGEINNSPVYSKTCMKLASSIDAVIALNASPSSLHLPRLVFIVQEVYKRKTELQKPSLMMLMLPIKAACQVGWFSDADKHGLLMIAKEVSYGFSSTDKMNIEPSNAHSCVSNIVSRFYPTMKVEHILTSFHVEAGYGTCVADFHISVVATPRHCRSVWLLVAQLDNMETAACITSPQNVDFLMNGYEVPNRTKSNMGKGPQLPSDVTKMIKYGVNLLQVFGDFDGRYIIALAFMNSVSSSDSSLLQDYLLPMSVDSDCAIIDMSSRISLNCPISQQRIKTPVKGHLCKHPQCFDYNHFIEVNSAIPTWKCPLCHNPVCNQDLRIDQDFLKILNEVAEDVHDVVISEDGSWMVAETQSDTSSHATVTAPVVSFGQTQVNACANKQAQSTTVFTPTAGSLGQTQVNTSATNQGSSDQIRVNVSTLNQGQSTTFTPAATVIKPEVSPGETQVRGCTTTQAKSTTMSTPSAESPDQIRVNVSTSNQGQSTTFTPPAIVIKPEVSPGETQVNVFTTTQVKTTTMLTPPEGSPTDQTRVNVCTSNQGQSTTFTPPAIVLKPEVSSGQTQVNAYTTTQTPRTPMFTPPASNELRKGSKQGSHTTPGGSQPPLNISQVSATQLLEASGGATPSGRMRGSLRGDQLQAARLQYLAPPRQPARANEPWSRPPVPSLPLPFIVPNPPTNSDHA
ncbi:putative Zinc finger, MIZ-type, Zinc finger, RING/FYVE/PHD-type [Helianthus annuus]|nr:putative Zinc finger, MIZ-type, Zinc finger, RING/FYVE/PHD-type [Helianthus annuus]KAJ0762461.1 putative Zinc finger, MIZ-type, Zinc finger, RING/FYVE/PHD-type [Helianthus annuus]